MKNTIKKIAAVLMVASTLLTCACNAKTDETNSVPETTATVETTTIQTPKTTMAVVVETTKSADKKIDYSKEVRTVKVPIYDDDDDFSVFGFNENGDILRSVNIPTGGGDTYYTYDEDGKLMKSVNTEGEHERERYEYFYEGDRLVRLDAYEAYGWETNDNIDRYYTYEYDENGNMIRKVCKNGFTHEFIYDETFEYDAEGNVVEEKIENGENCKYDSEGKLISEEIDGQVCTYEYENGFLVKSFRDGEISSEYKYFDNGNIVRAYHYESEDSIGEINIYLTSEMFF